MANNNIVTMFCQQTQLETSKHAAAAGRLGHVLLILHFLYPPVVLHHLGVSPSGRTGTKEPDSAPFPSRGVAVLHYTHAFLVVVITFYINALDTRMEVC
ncbi:hypothetical protein J6590_021305 [Homalodisca vitripennis]|nr:hypothetical protein J6590_021305 [Homalodisca vitripennis]